MITISKVSSAEIGGIVERRGSVGVTVAYERPVWEAACLGTDARVNGRIGLRKRGIEAAARDVDGSDTANRALRAAAGVIDRIALGI